jgi:hypothetical protein
MLVGKIDIQQYRDLKCTRKEQFVGYLEASCRWQFAAIMIIQSNLWLQIEAKCTWGKRWSMEVEAVTESRKKYLLSFAMHLVHSVELRLEEICLRLKVCVGCEVLSAVTVKISSNI